MNHPVLNLPEINPKLKTEATQEFIFDSIRKKYLVLTPEEWVRQHFIHLLIEHLKYPSGLFQLERQHEYFKSKKRFDILVMNQTGKPFLLIECKSYDVKINQGTLNQIATYNKTIEAPFIGVTNGLKHFAWQLVDGEYVQLEQFPAYTS
ncbi:MAG: type I restriction enzyme HsdR N-terminal domain-containing protein [Cytophagales bacterium]|nr:type I restriction enzyme HsdR N-terminal domain-containing protein [Cytophagales bacterium]